MKATVIALLDKPSPATLSVVPIVLSTDGGLWISGFDGGWRKILLHDLLGAYNLGSLKLVHEVQVDPLFGWVDLSAGWLGSTFEELRIELGLPGILHMTQLYVALGGRFWIEGTDIIIDSIRTWVQEAAVQAITRNSAEVAELMEQASPGHLDTRAALYYTRSTPEKKRSELEWFARLERDAGRKCDIRKLRKQLESRAQEIIEGVTS